MKKEKHISGLTAKEREVLQGIADGLGTKGVAGKLGITVNTVLTHRYRILKKLGVPDIGRAVCVGKDEDWLKPSPKWEKPVEEEGLA